MSNRDALVSRQLALFQALLPEVRALVLQSPDVAPGAADSRFLQFSLAADSGARLGQLQVELGSADAGAARRLAPAIECLRQELAAADAASRAIELKLLRLANELDIDFNDDPQLEKALGAIAHRTGAEVAWLSAPRCRLVAQAMPREQSLDAGVMHELKGLPGQWELFAYNEN